MVKNETCGTYRSNLVPVSHPLQRLRVVQVRVPECVAKNRVT